MFFDSLDVRQAHSVLCCDVATHRRRECCRPDEVVRILMKDVSSAAMSGRELLESSDKGQEVEAPEHRHLTTTVGTREISCPARKSCVGSYDIVCNTAEIPSEHASRT